MKPLEREKRPYHGANLHESELAMAEMGSNLARISWTHAAGCDARVATGYAYVLLSGMEALLTETWEMHEGPETECYRGCREQVCWNKVGPKKKIVLTDDACGPCRFVARSTGVAK